MSYVLLVLHLFYRTFSCLFARLIQSYEIMPTNGYGIFFVVISFQVDSNCNGYADACDTGYNDK